MSDQAKPRILLIDDALGDRNSAVQALAPRGYSLFTSGRAPKTVAQSVTEEAPDMLILDMTMHDLDAVEVLLAVRRVIGKLPVIIINASASATTVLKTLTLGNCDYLFRRLDGDRLYRLIQEALASARD